MRFAVVAACLVAGSRPATAHARDVTKTARSGDVQATLTYRVTKGSYSHVRVQVARAGQGLVDERLRELSCGRGCAVWAPGPFAVPGPVRVRDLDADGEPEVLLDLYTGGAHCCVVTAFYRWDDAAGRYRRTVSDFGNTGYGLGDLDGDGRPELRTTDERFAYAFGPYVTSLRPVAILQWSAGRLADVTRQFPAAIRSDAAELLRIYRQARRKRDTLAVRGTLAAWTADQLLLGQGTAAWAKLAAANRAGELGQGPKDEFGYPAGRRYIEKLRAFLRKNGYG